MPFDAQPPDFEVQDHGTIIAIRPVSETAAEWFTENVEVEPWQYMGGFVMIDAHLIGDLLDGIVDEGFEIGTP